MNLCKMQTQENHVNKKGRFIRVGVTSNTPLFPWLHVFWWTSNWCVSMFQGDNNSLFASGVLSIEHQS